MKGSLKWMAHNHVAANLLMMIFIIGGLVMGTSVKQEVFPEISLDRIQVSVPYPGASPEEVEEGILLKVEENLSGVQGIKEIKSTASEGFGTVIAEMLAGEDVDRVLQDVKAEVDRITTFPKDAEKPIITKLVSKREVISLVVYGNLEERSLREYAEAIRDELLSMPEITQADLGGVRPYEISIEVPEKNLRRYGLTLEQIAWRIRQASVDLPAGTVKSAGGEITIRTKERRYKGFEYADITILTNPDGTEVKLGEIANVRDTFQETDEFARFNGMPAAMIAVYRVGDQKPTTISKVVKQYVEEKQPALPDTVKIATWNDTSEIFESRMNLLLKNAFIGLTLVFFTLGLFLQIRLALFVMLGIPISFLGALFIMPAGDVSINMISLFAFILAIGIVVDDAIVVGENIYTHRQRGKPFLQAAVDGAYEIAGPVIFSVLTTVAAFLPLLFVSGIMGKFIKVIPFIVISILAVSLIESLFILPAHLSFGKPNNASGTTRVSRGVGRRLNRFIDGPYRRLLTLCTNYRYLTISTAIAVLLTAVGLAGGGIVKFRFMPEIDGDIVIASLKMPIGTPVEETSRIQEHIVLKAQELVREYDRQRPEGDTILRDIYSIIGGTIVREGPVRESSVSGAHLADVALLLRPSEEREIPAAEITRRWRKMVGEVPGTDSLTFSSTLMGFGANIDVSLAHDDFNVLRRVTDKIKTALAQYPGVEDIADTHTSGKRELKLRLRPEARTLGITGEELGRQIRAAFFGAEALRIQRGRNEVKVMVRYPEADRKSLGDLESMRIRTPQGGEIPFSQAAFVEEGRGVSSINRTNRKRVISVTATVDSKVGNAEEILLDLKTTLFKELSAQYPGLSFDLEGEEKERRESMASMKKGFIMAMFLIYALLAIPFRSYSQPLIVMTAIPFGIVGAIIGHLIMGFDLSILSMFGIVALSGVVVNNSLLLIDYTNRRRAEGVETKQAVIESGQRRFRPILLTSLTTFFGLSPMIAETSVQAQFLIPMALSLGYGVLFATGITLLLIPSLYLALEDVKNLFRK